uniref:Uncharacterized protein n=1 Tax=Molossus molossus TaxID=27622 RepID=A0A7J8JWM1_MOLMO|nr:hypothetical protein HJG59_007938 [Molossus molossus]
MPSWGDCGTQARAEDSGSARLTEQKTSHVHKHSHTTHTSHVCPATDIHASQTHTPTKYQTQSTPHIHMQSKPTLRKQSVPSGSSVVQADPALPAPSGPRQVSRVPMLQRGHMSQENPQVPRLLLAQRCALEIP